MSESVITYRGTIYPWHCDHMGHMNVMWYVGKFDEACWQMLSMVGLTRTRFGVDGSAIAAVEQHIYYERELYAGNVVSIRSKVLEVRDKSIRIRHELWNDEAAEIAAVTEMTGVYMDAAVRRARSLPLDVRERLLCLVSDGSDFDPADMATALIEKTR